MQKVNSPMRRFSSKFFGVVFSMLAQVILVLPVTAQHTYTPANLQIPAFTQTEGTVPSNTNGNWVTVNPQQPDNISLLETKLYEMPHKGSGLMAAEFKLVGADGGTAQYELYTPAQGGQGAALTYTINLDASVSGKPFLVTFGKKGGSSSFGAHLYCTAGGGGSTGMAWVAPNAQFCQLNYDGDISVGPGISVLPNSPGYLIAAAGGGGGGFAIAPLLSSPSDGGGASSFETTTGVIYNQTAYDTFGVSDNGATEIFVAGGSILSFDPTLLNEPTCCNNSDIFQKASSGVHNVFNVTTGVIIGSGTVLDAITFGQGGGQATDIIDNPSSQVYNGDAGQTIYYVNHTGASGGCGFGGGGAGTSNSTYFAEGDVGHIFEVQAAGGGGGTGSIFYPTVPNPLSGGPGGTSFANNSDSYLSNISLTPGTTTSSPQSGYFEYRTVRDTILPVIGAFADTIYIGNGTFGFPNTSVSLTAANANVSDNDSVKTIYFSKTVFGCSDVGTTQIITVEATDFAGNSSQGQIMVTVLDTVRPFIPFLIPPDPFDPGSYATYTIDVTTGPYTLTAANFPGADAGCDTNLTIHFTPTTFTCAQAGTQQTIYFYYTNSAGISSNGASKTFTITASNPSVLYVDASATGANNGSSWANAFTHLQDAITYGCTSQRSIYVAQGTYYPDQGYNESVGDREASFILNDGVTIYGGFPSGGTVLNNRNPSAYVTILDGNINNPNASTDNCYHVVTIAGNNTLLNGLTIQNGYANDSAGSGGGGIFWQETSPYSASIVNCNLLNNFGNMGGGAYVNSNNSSSSNNISFTNCIFQGNSTTGNGGAAYFITTSPLMQQSLVNCQFNVNMAANGGAIYASGHGWASLYNCTFSRNKASASGGAYYNGGKVSAGNNIFYYDTAAGAQNEVVNNGQFLAAYNDIQGSGGSGNWNTNIGTDIGNNLDSLPQFVPSFSQVASFQIYPYSGCRNRGNTSYNTQALDLAGNPRVSQDTVDMGAYESNPVVYVAIDAPNGGDGKSWATAYNDLQTGLNDAGNVAYPNYAKDVWVKKGTYYPDSANGRFSSFTILTSNALYGGFAGNETAVSQRNIGANPTILSGDLGVKGDNSDNTYHVIALNGGNPRLDGLIIQDGNANYTAFVDKSGGAIYDESINSHPVAANCVFRNNTASLYGGAVDIQLDTFDFIQCVFYNNSASRGGAIYVENGDPDTSDGSAVVARFYNCTGINNTASGFNTGGFSESTLVNVSHSNIATAQFNNCLLLNDGNPITSAFDGGNTIYNNTYAGTNNNDLVNINDPAGPDSLIMTADDGFALQPGSNAVNYGSNAYTYPGDTVADITGGQRIKQLVVDAGAYEEWGCLGITTLYVDGSVDTVNGDGKTWATAYRYLGDALQMAKVCPSVDSILIAQGTYYPSGNVNGIVRTDTSFNVANPVHILGGYPTGGGTRNVLQYPVILSGAINTQSNTDNTKHIMLIATGTTDTTVIDGITFTGGYAVDGPVYSFNGQTFLGRHGGAISAIKSLVHVNNCIFQSNNALSYGGAIYVVNGKFISTRSVYENNSAAESGAVCLDGVSDTVVLTGNVFLYDSALNGIGGAVGTIASSTYADVENNVFSFNSSPQGGGAGLYLGPGIFRVINNTFYHNNASTNATGGGFYSPTSPSATTLFANNIFWQNTANINNMDYDISPYITATGNATGINPLFADTANPLGADGLWFTADDGLELKPTSPFINSGTDSAIALSTDITGAPRVQLGAVDPGAYEAVSEVTRWYVSQAQDSLPADGASWATAFQKFQQGVNAAKPGDTVWVAAGIYSPDSAGTSFSMKSSVKIYGGFNATEQSLAQRNLGAGYNATLQGNGASVIVNTDVDSLALLDGFVITGGYSADQGGGMLNDSSSPLIRNVVFTGNVATNNGGGMFNVNSSPIMQNVVFNADSAGVDGGAIYCNTSAISITNSTFYNNTAGFAGAIFSDTYSPLTVGNSIFNNNTQQSGFDIFIGGTGNFTYCMLQYARTGTGNIVATNPYFNFAQNPAGFDGAWFTGDDGLYPGYLSAALNNGSNSLTTGLTTDITGALRIQNGTVDMGAYESPWVSYCDSESIKNQRILYVDGSLPASGDGSDWLNAFSTLGEALDRANACSDIDTILVAKGTYYPTGWQGFTDRTASFDILRSGIHLIGGYPTGGGERNTGLNNTWLSGDIGVKSLMGDNSFHVVTFTTSSDSSGLDGFIITGGNADSASTYGYGGGIFNNGAGNNSMPVISNCALVNNRAGYGGAVFNQGQLSGNASATFINCVFTGDSAYDDGGAMYSSGLIGNASPVITNCTFYGNNASRNGGAVYDYGASGTCSTALLNCILWGNTAGSGAANVAQVYSSSATDSVSYSLIQDGIPALVIDGGNNISTDPLFVADSTPSGFTNTWFNEYNGLAVKVGSPAVRKGRPAGAPATDITGSNRLPVPDMGAYQLQDTAANGYVSITTTGCDSIFSPSYRYVWNTSGTYNDTTSNVLGNDTFYTVNLTLGKTTYTTISPQSCGSYVSPAGRTYDTSGVYKDTLQTAFGCDSLITINLIIAPINDTATVNGATCTVLQNNASYQWVHCASGQPVTGATQQTFTATNNGNYACVIAFNSCTDTSNCVAVTDLSITETTAYHFNVYPNPTAGLFTIEQNYNSQLNLQIVDVLGRTVRVFTLEKPVQQFDITDLAAGVYQAFISNGNELLDVVKIVHQ